MLEADNLKKGSKAFLNKEERTWLERLNANEFESASRSLLIGLPTSAGFYLVRLCERVLRELYKKETGKDVKKKTWGVILDELEAHYKGKKPNILHLVSYLKDIRNSIAHPERTFTQEEAEELLTYTTRVIREIKDHTKSLDS